jgi:hypothetical protein
METSEQAEQVGLGRKPQPAPKKYTTIAFDDMGYEGWEALVWYNAPTRYYAEMFDIRDNPEKAINRILDVVVEWNFIDEDGEPVPHDLDGLNSGALPTEILQEMVLRARNAANEYRGLDPRIAGRSSPTSPGDSSPGGESPTPTPSPSLVSSAATG